MIVLTPESTPLEFALFDTFLPHNHPAASRRFRLPRRCHDWDLAVHVDVDRCLGMLDRDRPLTADPTQAVFVVELGSRQGVRVLLIVRVQALDEYVRSASTDGCVDWDEWGRGAVVMGDSRGGDADGCPHPFVHGTHVVAVTKYYIHGVDGHHNLSTFDFSRRGWSTLPVCDEGFGAERRVTVKDGQYLSLQGDQVMDEWAFDSLGGGRLVYLVSRFRYRKVVGC